MAYQTKQLNLIAQSVGDNGGALWSYLNLDADTSVTILAANFISDAEDKGMKVGDFVMTTLDTGAAALYSVTTVAATGADLS